MDSSEKMRLIEAHQPHWSSVWIWLGFVAAFVLVQGLLLWAMLAGSWWLAVPLVLLLGHLMHAHLIAFHEAAHGTLCPHPGWNDALGIFIGNLGFTSLSLFRAVHHSHHAFLTSERDEELWPFVLPGTPRWARRLAAVAELTVGLFYTPVLFLRTFLRRGPSVQAPALRRRIWAEFAVMAGFWALVLPAVAWFDVWKFFGMLYLLPALLAGNLQSLRKYIEHMGMTGATVLAVTRSVVPQGPVGRLVAFSLFNIAYHGIHHQFARMPFGALPEFTPILTPVEPEEPPPFPNYRQACWDMLRTLADPRIGPQWRSPASVSGQPPLVRVGQQRGEQTVGADGPAAWMPTAQSDSKP